MPLKENEKLQRFADDVFSQANAKREQILTETQERYEELLEQGVRKIREETQDYLEKEIKELRRDSNRQLSRHTMRQRKELLLYRESLIRRLSDDVGARIAAFIASPEYKDYLIRLCIWVLSDRDADFVLHLSERDMKYKDDLLKAISSGRTLGRVLDILPEKNIRLGGIRFWSAGSGILINETIDESLERRHEHFIKLIGPVSKAGRDDIPAV